MKSNIFGSPLYGEIIYRQYKSEQIIGTFPLSLSYDINYSFSKYMDFQYAVSNKTINGIYLGIEIKLSSLTNIVNYYEVEKNDSINIFLYSNIKYSSQDNLKVNYNLKGYEINNFSLKYNTDNFPFIKNIELFTKINSITVDKSNYYFNSITDIIVNKIFQTYLNLTSKIQNKSEYYLNLTSINSEENIFYYYIGGYIPRYLNLYAGIYSRSEIKFNFYNILTSLLSTKQGFYIKIAKDIDGLLNFYTFVNKGTFFIMVYQFIVTPYDSTGSLIIDFEWELYQRDSHIDLFDPVDENHILVDNGIEPTGILQIDLADYGLDNIDDDYFIRIKYEGVLVGTTYVEYDHNRFFSVGRKQPYHQISMIHKVTRIGGGGGIVGGGAIMKVEEEIARPKIRIKSLTVENLQEKNITVKILHEGL
jgi:hypothetical protein